MKAFTNDGAVTQGEDKENSVISSRGKMSMQLGTGMMMLTGAPNMTYEMACEIRVKDGRYKYEFSDIEVVNQGYRIKVDDQFRKNPKYAQKLMEKEFTQREYDKYMGDKNPIQRVVRQLKQTMSSAKDKNDF